jgi:predicted HTH domain antitoxin
MREVTLYVPDDLDLALNVQPGALPRELLFAAAVKLFELGKISSGKAAELAGIPKPLFLSRLADIGISASTLRSNDITEEISNA